MGQQEKPAEEDQWDPRDLENEEEEGNPIPDHALQLMFQNLAMNIPRKLLFVFFKNSKYLMYFFL